MQVNITNKIKKENYIFFDCLSEDAGFLMNDALYIKIKEVNLANGGYYNAICIGNQKGCNFFLVNIEKEASVLPVDLGLQIDTKIKENKEIKNEE